MTQLTFRPASLSEAALAADLMTASYPALAADPVVTRYRWEHARAGWAIGRYIAELDGRPVAYLDWRHGPPEQDPDRHCEVSVWLDRAALSVERLVTLWRWISDQATAAGSRILEGYAGEDEPEMLEALKRVGYERDRLEKVWELDLGDNGAALTAQARTSREQAEASGYRLLTVAEWQAPNKFEAIHELDTVTRKDIPTTFPILPETFENFMERCAAPDRPHDRWWVAVRGDEPVTMSYLRFPPVRGSIWTGYTCCHPAHRGRGLARAVKLQSLAQAVALGVPFVYTDNDSENAPMLHINHELGYHPRPGFAGHLMRVNTTNDA